MEMENTMKTFEEDNMLKYLDEDEANSILKKKKLELSLARYMDKEDKVKININKIMGLYLDSVPRVFNQC